MLNLESEGNLIGIVIKDNKDNKDINKKLYVTDNITSVRNGTKHFECKSDETLQLVPNNKVERSCLYICGQSGSGKSFFTSNYMHQYKKQYPKKSIFVISSIESDKSIDSVKPIRIKVLNPDFMDEELTSEDFKDSLVVFDDIDVFPSKIRKKIMTIVNNILQIGRHFNVSICFTTHTLTNGNESKILLSEANAIVVFPKTTGNRTLKYLLDNYLGLDAKQIKKIKSLKSRAVTIIRGYPMVILSQSEAFLAHEF